MNGAAARLLDRDERALVGTAERLADERFAPRAAALDEAAEFPHEDFDDLRAQKLHLMRVPRTYGGLGLSPLAYSLVLTAVARANASTGLALNMHTGACACIDFLGDEARG